MMNKRTIVMLVIGMAASVVATDLIIDALFPDKSLAFTYRLITNVGIVAICGIIYWKKK